MTHLLLINFSKSVLPKMKLPVIQYHRIDLPGPNSRIRGGFTPPLRFRRQMEYLKAHDFVFYTASELVEYFQEYGIFPHKGIAVTFDDGCRDNYTNAFPVLRRLGIKATMFLVTSCLGKRSSLGVPEGEDPQLHVSRDEVLEMSRHGIEFGSHTISHRLLDRIPLEQARVEVEGAKRELENLLQEPCKTFAYPSGFYSRAVRRIVFEAGHLCAFSTTMGPEEDVDFFALNRIEIRRRDRFIFQLVQKLWTFPEIYPLRIPSFG